MPTYHLYTAVQLLNHVQLFCIPTDYSPPGSSVHGILQEKIMEQFSFPSPVDLPYPGIKPTASALQVDFLLLSHHSSPVSTQVMSIRQILSYIKDKYKDQPEGRKRISQNNIKWKETLYTNRKVDRPFQGVKIRVIGP